MSELLFTFDCASRVYDLSRTDLLTDEVKMEFDAWFKVPHEEAPKAPNDEALFQMLLSPQKAPLQKENISENQLRARKRSIGELTQTSSSLPKAARVMTGTSSASTLVSRPVKSVRSNAAVSNVSGAVRPAAVMKSTPSLGARAGSSPRPRPTTSVASSSSVSNATTNPPTNSETAKNRLQTKAVSILKSRSVSAGKTRPAGAKPAAAPAFSIEQLLKEHNAKFAPVPVYEPPKHSVRDVRKWEKLSGRQWCELKPEERQSVNEEIARLKETDQLS